MENFEKCTVAMLGGPCSQHVTGIISYLGMKSWYLQVCDRASTITHVEREKKNSAY